MCTGHGGGSTVSLVPPPADEADRVRAIWGGLGLPGMIDVHTHFMPDRVLAKVWDYFDAVGELTPRDWPIAYRFDEPERLRRLREFGVVAFTSMLYPHKPGMAAWLNDWSAGFAAATPDCVHTATFYPEPSAPMYVAAAIEGGVRIFKSHIQVGDYDPNDPLLDEVWAMIAEARLPVVIHAGSGPAPGRFTGPEPIATLLARHPDLALVIAHLGLPEFTEFFDLAERYPKVRLDTTMVFTDYCERYDPFPMAERRRLTTLGDRILFGSDYPNIPYPYVHSIDALVRLDLGPDWLRAVLFDNAASMLDISQAKS